MIMGQCDSAVRSNLIRDRDVWRCMINEFHDDDDDVFLW